MNKTEKSIIENDNYKYFIIFEGIFIGIAAGFVVSVYRYLLAVIFDLALKSYAGVDTVSEVITMFTVLIVLGVTAGAMVKAEPMISGSGIPQVEGVLIGKMRFKWLKVLTLKFLGGLICLGAGLSLGREGPSVQIGAAIGQGAARLSRTTKTRERYLLTFGAAAGLAAAFNAPLAGLLFVLEELHKSFNKYIVIGGMMSGITADMVSKSIFGTAPVFSLGELNRIPTRQSILILGLGIILGLLAVLFNRCIIFCSNNYGKVFRLPDVAKPVPAFILTGIIAITLPMLLGGGHSLIDELSVSGYGIGFMVVLLIVKFAFTQFCFASKSPGGIFLPLLCIGALAGAIFSQFLTEYLGIDKSHMSFFIALSLAGFFGAVTKAPITGIILVCEMTGNFNQFLFLAVVSITAFIVTEMCHCGPVYEMLLQNTLGKQKKPYKKRGDRIIIEIPIALSSRVVNKTVAELKAPKNMLLVSVKREGEEIVPKGDLIIKSGDELVILLYENDLQKVEEYFNRERKL